MMWVAVLFFALVAFLKVQPSSGGVQHSCSSVDLPMCKDIMNASYTTPITENYQKELKLDHYRALINIGCSQFTTLFICLAHLPFCPPLHPDLQALQPCRSLCVHVYENCLKYFTLANLPWPQHLNCSLFPRQPTLCIKPYSSTAPPSSLHSSSKSSSKPSPTTLSQTTPSQTTLSQTTPSQTTPSPHKQSTTTPSPTKPSKPAPTTAQDSNSRFIFFVVNFLPKFFFAMIFAFAIIWFSVAFLLFSVFSYFCWLRIRGRKEQAGARGDIPLKEILGPLPPVPEQE